MIYLIQCTKCGMQYVGETGQCLHQRMNNHRADVTSKQLEGKPVGRHDKPQHSVEDMKVTIIDYLGLKDDLSRKCRESEWIRKLCAGAIDESHIPVSPPALNHTDYYNRKGWYSVILQGVIDHRFLFHEINIGWPGSVHKVLTNSALFKKAENGSILTEHQRMINGCNIPVFLIGNSAYPLKKWLLKPFADNDRITAQQRNFNYQFSRTRIVVEKAFGRTKGSMANAD
ncbi:uncharacterized protein LOC134185402 [Corticium candelabrum]|uniref:uncharacterized protein LOC134185402 n=1 Tax=Corticium candelabrum TaxID=121492 RepID=UPI002E26CEF6|nr:uncharacterized protein LOC134185402 [Corticium candelabrum]